MTKYASRLQTLIPLCVLLVLVVMIGLYDRTFFSVNNILTLSADTMTLFLMASGVTLVIMMGGIDLSVQAVASMTSCILAAYLPHLGFWALPLAVAGGVIAGISGGARINAAQNSVFHCDPGGEWCGYLRGILVFQHAQHQYFGG